MPATVPTAEEVTAYLAAHRLEATIEEAVNDAVLKQVPNPFQHIAELLLKKAAAAGGGPSAAAGKVGFSTNVAMKEASGDAASEEQLSREYVKKENVKLKPALEEKLRAFFNAMDADGDGNVTKEEAIKFWGKNFAKVNAQSMFNEVDEDGNSEISWSEFIAFWQNVVGSGYDEADLEEEVEDMAKGASWVDFNDGRTT